MVEKETVDRRKCILRTTAGGGSLAVKEMRKKLRLLQKNKANNHVGLGRADGSIVLPPCDWVPTRSLGCESTKQLRFPVTALDHKQRLNSGSSVFL